MGFTHSELEEYDKHVDFYHSNLINALILYTYEEKDLDKMAPILIDPLTELYEELDYAFEFLDQLSTPKLKREKKILKKKTKKPVFYI